MVRCDLKAARGEAIPRTRPGGRLSFELGTWSRQWKQIIPTGTWRSRRQRDPFIAARKAEPVSQAPSSFRRDMIDRQQLCSCIGLIVVGLFSGLRVSPQFDTHRR